MTSTRQSAAFVHDAPGVLGVLIANLGTPERPTPEAVRRYLAEFLSDPRVVEFPRLPWWLILHGFILRFRPARVARNYARIWTPEGSPLLVTARAQESALQRELERRLRLPVKVALGMRYGQPSIESAMTELRKAGCRRLVVLPLYPQYSSTTTASIFDAVMRVLMTWRWIPETRLIQHYHDHPEYIEALTASIQRVWAKEGRPDRLLFSFHGIPKRYQRDGDPYFCECHKTARLVAERLRLEPERWQVAFQSRFGHEEWLRPYVDETLTEWAKQGIETVHVVAPGFSADCLETLEELNLQNRERFLKAGGSRFEYIPALNAHPSHIEALASLVERHLCGWPEADPQYSLDRDRLERRERLARARALGADT
ncbi:MAG: ferrochelatase [Gammaproteobacteria bacterium]|nr:MAG: ferrochelatase [Gammaproteobacteria bacterium]